MIKKIILRLIPIIALGLALQSCRTNEDYASSKNEDYYSNKFQVFTKPDENGKINYQKGFAFLFQEYDRIHKTNLTGLKLSEVNSSLQNKDLISEKHIDFGMSSQTINPGNGETWVYFPVVENGKMIDIAVGVLQKEETYVQLGRLDQGKEYKQMVLEKFRAAYLKKAFSRNIDAGDPPPCIGTSGNPCDIDEVLIPGPQCPCKPTVFVGTTPDQGGGGGDCGTFNNCGGGSGAGPRNPPKPKDPCGKASANNIKSKELLNKAKIMTAKGQITSSLSTDTNEKSFSYGKDSSGNYDTTPIKTSTAGNQVGVQASNPNLSIEGGVHTHTVDLYNCFSAGDIYSLQGANAINSNFTTFFVFANGGIGYALTIIDPVKYANFVANYSAGNNLDMSTSHWQTTSPIYVSFESAMTQFIDQGYSQDDAMANATAFVLSKYDVGAALSQSDFSGNFNSIFVEENVHNVNVSGVIVPISTYKQTPDCNLK